MILKTSGIVFLVIWFSVFEAIWAYPTSTHDSSAASNTATLLLISIHFFCISVLQDMGYDPRSVPPWRDKYGTLISSVKVLICKHDSAPHYTPPNSVGSRSCTTNHLYTLSTYNQPPCTPEAIHEIAFSFGCKT